MPVYYDSLPTPAEEERRERNERGAKAPERGNAAVDGYTCLKPAYPGYVEEYDFASRLLFDRRPGGDYDDY